MTIEDIGMASSPAMGHPSTGDACPGSGLNRLKAAVATVLSNDVENENELNFDETDIIALFKKEEL